MFKVVFDLDGVLRDLMGYLHYRFNVQMPNKWYWKHEGKDIFKLIEEDNYNALFDSGTTEYFSTIIKFIEIPEIWTDQPLNWRDNTNIWLNNYLDKYTIKYFTNKQKRERLDKYKNIWLVEDSPNFKNYNNIILVDRSYNKNVMCEHRVKNGKELINKIRELNGNR